VNWEDVKGRTGKGGDLCVPQLKQKSGCATGRNLHVHNRLHITVHISIICDMSIAYRVLSVTVCQSTLYTTHVKVEQNRTETVDRDNH